MVAEISCSVEFHGVAEGSTQDAGHKGVHLPQVTEKPTKGGLVFKGISDEILLVRMTPTAPHWFAAAPLGCGPKGLGGWRRQSAGQ